MSKYVLNINVEILRQLNLSYSHIFGNHLLLLGTELGHLVVSLRNVKPCRYVNMLLTLIFIILHTGIIDYFIPFIAAKGVLR